MKPLKLFRVIATLGFLFFSLSSPGVYARDFSELAPSYAPREAV